MSRTELRFERIRDPESGFTLLEVLLATLVFATTMGMLISAVTQSIAGLGNARREVEASRLALQRARSIETLAADGELQQGVREGRYPSPDDDLIWQESVEPAHLPLPSNWRATAPPASPLWSNPQAPENPPVLYRVDVRVYPDGLEPETVSPVTLFVVIPVEIVEEGGAIE